MMKKCVVIGGGGHAKVVLDALLLEGRCRPVAVTDPDTTRRSVLGVPIVGGDEALPGLRRSGALYFVIGLGGVPRTEPRAKLFRKALDLRLKPLTVIHPSASVSGHATIGEGSVALAQSAVSAGVRIGRNVIVNTGAIVEHDSTVADHVHLCPGSRLSGGVAVAEGAFVGAGAVVREGVSIGAWSIIGAGAVVLSDVPDGATVVGVPARILKRKGKTS